MEDIEYIIGFSYSTLYDFKEKVTKKEYNLVVAPIL